MSGYLFRPYPLSLFSKIERIRELTKGSEIVDFNVKKSGDPNHGDFNYSNGEEVADKTKDDTGMDVDKETGDIMEVRASDNKIQSEIEVNISEFLETDIFNLKLLEKSEIIYRQSSPPTMNAIGNFLKGILIESQRNHDKLIILTDRIQALSDTLFSSLTSPKENIELLADDLKEFVVLFPSSGFNIVVTLLSDIDAQELIHALLSVIENDLTDDQYETILSLWLQKHSIDSNTLKLPELILTKKSKLYEDANMMELLASSLSRSLSDQRNKCSKFSKFLLQVVSKVTSTCDQSVFQSLSTTVENNKTFFEKADGNRVAQKMSNYRITII